MPKMKKNKVIKNKKKMKNGKTMTVKKKNNNLKIVSTMSDLF